MRTSTFFSSEEGGSKPAQSSARSKDTDMFDPSRLSQEIPGTADEGMRMLEHEYGAWHRAISALDADGFARLLGPRGAYFADEPMVALILHVNREVMPHAARSVCCATSIAPA